MIPTLLGITLVVFTVSRAAPGDPLSVGGPNAQLDADRAADVREARARIYGLDKPVHIQYFTWLGKVARLDFGNSIKHHRPVWGLIRERVGITIGLNLASYLLIFAISLPLGTLSAVGHKRFFDRSISVVVLMLWSMPVMFVGQQMIIYLSKWFPVAGLSSNDAGTMAFLPWIGDRLWHVVLPVLCLTYTGFAVITKQVRAGMLDNLRMDYIVTARAKGLREWDVVIRHAFRNSILPVITIMATLLPAMISGSVIVESIFSIPGMGRLAVEAMSTRDYNVIMAVATIAGVLNLTGLLLVDIAYAFADPRISFEGAGQ